MHSCFRPTKKNAFAIAVACILFVAGSVPAEAQSADASMARIKARGEVVIGYRQSSIPFSYLDASQKPVGYTIDLCMAVVEALKRQISQPDLRVRFVPVDLSTIIPLLQNGSIDMECGSTVYTLQRSAQIDFSFVTAAASDHLLVKAESKVKEIEDLAGKSLAVPAGSTNAALAQSINARESLHIRFIFVKDQAEGFLTLSTGRADAYMSDNVLLSGLIQRSSNPSAFRITGRSLSYLPYGIVIAPNNPALFNAINSTLAETFRSGMAERLYEKWFSQIGMQADPAVLEIPRVANRPVAPKNGETIDYKWNWRAFYDISGDGTSTYAHNLVAGAGWTIATALSSAAIALLVGVPIGLLRGSPSRLKRCLASTYIEIFRDIPLLVQMFIWYFVVPELLPSSLGNWIKGLASGPFLTASLALGLYAAARVGEQTRSTITALPKGQLAAGIALGLGKRQVLRLIVMPQALRMLIPPLTSEMVNIVKNTSVGMTIGLMELTARAREMQEATFHTFEAFAAATVGYLLINLCISTALRAVEARVHGAKARVASPYAEASLLA